MEVEYAFRAAGRYSSGLYCAGGGQSKAVGYLSRRAQRPPSDRRAFAVINADDYYGPGAFASIYDHLEQAQDDEKYRYCMVGYQLENTLTEKRPCGPRHLPGQRQRLSGGHRWSGQKIMRRAALPPILRTTAKSWHELAEGTTVSMNFWGLHPVLVREMEARFPAFLDKALAENPLKGEYFLPGVVDQ